MGWVVGFMLFGVFMAGAAFKEFWYDYGAPMVYDYGRYDAIASVFLLALAFVAWRIESKGKRHIQHRTGKGVIAVSEYD